MLVEYLFKEMLFSNSVSVFSVLLSGLSSVRFANFVEFIENKSILVHFVYLNLTELKILVASLFDIIGTSICFAMLFSFLVPNKKTAQSYNVVIYGYDEKREAYRIIIYFGFRAGIKIKRFITGTLNKYINEKIKFWERLRKGS